MTHERYKEWLQLEVVDELSDEQRTLLVAHVHECEACHQELQELREMKMLIDNHAPEVPSEHMLWQARERLMGSLEEEPAPQSVLGRVQKTVTPGSVAGELGRAAGGWMNWFSGFRLAATGVAAVVLGVYIGYLSFGRGPQSAQTAASPDVWPNSNNHELGPADVANVRFVNSEAPGGNDIELHYDLVRPVRLRAPANDARMQRMLAYALLNEENDGVRLQALSAFDANRAVGQTPGDEVKRALIEAAVSDPNVGVRKQSLEVLSNYKFDDDIKAACLSVLSADRNPGMRVAAINVLAQAAKRGDAQQRQELYDLVRTQGEDEPFLLTNTNAIIEEANDGE